MTKKAAQFTIDFNCYLWEIKGAGFGALPPYVARRLNEPDGVKGLRRPVPIVWLFFLDSLNLIIRF